MSDLRTSNGNYSFDYVFFPSEYSNKFNEYMEEYGALSDREIYDLITKTKGQVSNDLVQQHIENLDTLSNMKGFSNESTRRRIALAKEALNSNTETSNQDYVETQFWGGSSLLLWFLLLTSIYRRPFVGPYRRRFRRPFRRPFGRPYY